MDWIFTARRRLKYLLVVALVLLGMTCLTTTDGVYGADGSGLSLTLLSDPNNPENLYPLSESPEYPIKLIMVLKNISGQNINTERGLSKVELHRTLTVTDPCGTVLELSPEADVFAYDAPPPFLLNGLPTVPAESLAPDFVRSLTIADLRQLFPVMKKTPGLYNVEAQLPGARYVWVIMHPSLGLQAVANHPANWFGTINADKMQIYISPVSGARLQVRLEELDTESPRPLFQVPVKAFKTSDIPDEYEPEETWVKIEPVLTGTTDAKGQVVWGSCDSCVPADEYTVIAFYQNEYRQSHIDLSDSGWNTGCSSVIAKIVSYGEPGPVVPAKFSIFALNSVQLNIRSVVLSGDIGAKTESSGLYNSGIEVSVGIGARVNDGVKIIGDTVRIGRRARVYDVYYNELENKGKILGEQITPLELPVWQEPPFLESDPGNEDIKVKSKKGKKGKKGKKDDKDPSVVELAAGAYDEVEIDKKGELHLLGGTYHFSSMKLDKDAALICLAPATILVAEGLEGHDEVYIGPAANSGISAADIVLYIGGIEEKKGKKKKPKPKAKKVVIGKKSKVAANIYAPNSTFEIGKECEIEGSFIAKDVIVGIRTKVKLDSAFQ